MGLSDKFFHMGALTQWVLEGGMSFLHPWATLEKIAASHWFSCSSNNAAYNAFVENTQVKLMRYATVLTSSLRLCASAC